VLPEGTLEGRVAAITGGVEANAGTFRMLCTIVNGKEKRVEQREVGTERAELRVTSEEPAG
jgi:hypothetical protein